MQLVNCEVKLASKHYHSVNRINVSVAEAQLLLQIHGDEALHPSKMEYAGVRPARDADGNPWNEKEHLIRVYGSKDETLELIEKLFPGINPNMATEFAQIGYPNVATAETVDAYERKREKAAKEEAEQKRKLRDARRRKIEALNDAEDAMQDEDEIIQPPPQKATRTLRARPQVESVLS